MKSFEIIY